MVAHFSVALLTNKPLYGGRDAPLRWFLRISTLLRSSGWRQMRMDCCSFVRYKEDPSTKPQTVISSFIIVYVDDILIAANKPDWGRFAKAMQQLEVGEISYLKTNMSLDFIGHQLEKEFRRLNLHQYEEIYRWIKRGVHIRCL